MKSIRKIVVLGANGAMGAGSGAVFAAAGIPTTFLARTLEKAEAGRERAVSLGKGAFDRAAIACGTYASDLGHALADADLVLEAVAEDLATKREVFAVVDRLRNQETIVASGAIARPVYGPSSWSMNAMPCSSASWATRFSSW